MNAAIIHFTSPSGNQSPQGEQPATSGEVRPTDPMPNNLRHIVATELTALFTQETSRRNNEWRRGLESIKSTLTALQRTCEAAGDTLTESQSTPAAAVSELVEKLVAAATSDSEAAVQRACAAAQSETARVQELLRHQQAESQAERDKLKTAREEIDTERRARAGAEAARQEAQVAFEQTTSTFQAQLQDLQAQLEAEKAERTKLLAALQAVQRLVSFTEPVGSIPVGSIEDTRQPTPRKANKGPEPIAREADNRAERVEARDGATDAARRMEPAPVANSSLKLVDNAHAPGAQADPELVAYVKQLLDEIEAIYWADVDAKRRPAEVVDRLIANLRYAHGAFARRCDSAPAAETTLFERQMMTLLDTKAETSFARHLAVAAYEVAASHDLPPHPCAEAS